MQIGILGLGRMGANMARRLLRSGHGVVVFDRNPEPGQALATEGAVPVANLQELVQRLAAPRAIWLMLPAGTITEHATHELASLLAPGDCLIDGGNSFYKDDRRRAESLKEKGIHYLDVGTSGGVWGLERGYCLMIGGEAEAVQRLEPIFAALAPGVGSVPPSPGSRSTAPRGYLHCGPAGAGHFVKMIHNGIEYGLMQAYAEGFELLRGRGEVQADTYDLPLGEIAELWRRGSVIGSWLLDLAARALLADANLSAFQGQVPDSGEGRWTVQTAVEQGIPAEVITTALMKRFRSRQQPAFAEQLLSALRAEFGGHREATNGRS